jgi:hypothetical protein
MSTHTDLEALADKWDREAEEKWPGWGAISGHAIELRRALLAAEPGEPGSLSDRVMRSPEVRAWLIEDPKSHPGKFWHPDKRTGVDWVDDANRAVRFLRHNDANEVIAARTDMNELWVAREHIWMGRPAPDGLREALEKIRAERSKGPRVGGTSDRLLHYHDGLDFALAALSASAGEWLPGTPCPDCGGDYDRGHNPGCPHGPASAGEPEVKA